MKKLLVLVLALLMLTSVFLSGCSNTTSNETTVAGGSGQTTPVENQEPTTLVVGITEASGNFNPLYYSSSYDGYTVNLVFAGLFSKNIAGDYIPSVAESWEFSEDGKSITFKMRQDVKFSDGEALTADDVIFTYKVLADPSYTGRYGSAVKDMVGYKEYSSGETTEFKLVEKIDDYTVKFNFNESLRINFTNCGYPILPEHYYGAEYKLGDVSSVEKITSNPVGAGPYKVQSFEEKQLVYLTKNENFFGTGYAIDEIIMKFVDQTTDITELLSGNVDLLSAQIEPKKIQEARNNGFTLNEYTRSGYGYIKTNNQSGPTADKLVRQALYYSFNIEEFVNSYFFDSETNQVLANIQYHPFSAVSWVMDESLLNELTEYKFDLEKAKSLLDEAGWKVGASGFREKDGQVLELKIAAMPDHDILNTLIPMWERDWGQGLNVKLTIAYLEFNTILDYVLYNSDANVDNWSLYFLATSINSNDPHSIYSTFHSDYIGSGKDNTSRYSNPEVDKLLDEAKVITDIEQAKPYYRQIAKILNDDAVMMPVYSNIYYDLYAPKLKNFVTNSLYDWTAALEDAYIEE